MKRIVSIIILLAVLFSSVSFVMAEDSSSSFSDVKEDAWYYGAVEEAKARGLISGYSDGTFRPNNNVTYPELLAMLYSRATTRTTYDFPGKHWAYDFYHAAYWTALGSAQMPDLQNYEKTEKYGILRKNAAVLIYQSLLAYGLYEPDQSPEHFQKYFEDVAYVKEDGTLENVCNLAMISDYYYIDEKTYAFAADALRATGILSGVTRDVDGLEKHFFNPNRTLTRAEAASLIVRWDDYLKQKGFAQKTTDYVPMSVEKMAGALSIGRYKLLGTFSGIHYTEGVYDETVHYVNGKDGIETRYWQEYYNFGHNIAVERLYLNAGESEEETYFDTAIHDMIQKTMVARADTPAYTPQAFISSWKRDPLLADEYLNYTIDETIYAYEYATKSKIYDINEFSERTTTKQEVDLFADYFFNNEFAYVSGIIDQFYKNTKVTYKNKKFTVTLNYLPELKSGYEYEIELNCSAYTSSSSDLDTYVICSNPDENGYFGYRDWVKGSANAVRTYRSKNTDIKNGIFSRTISMRSPQYTSATVQITIINTANGATYKVRDAQNYHPNPKETIWNSSKIELRVMLPGTIDSEEWMFRKRTENSYLADIQIKF